MWTDFTSLGIVTNYTDWVYINRKVLNINPVTSVVQKSSVGNLVYYSLWTNFCHKMFNEDLPNLREIALLITDFDFNT